LARGRRVLARMSDDVLTCFTDIHHRVWRNGVLDSQPRYRSLDLVRSIWRRRAPLGTGRQLLIDLVLLITFHRGRLAKIFRVGQCGSRT